MSFGLASKENLHLKMIDLQKKLKESEEERRKLEKTCNVLIKNFKEREKIQYKALNNKYEKFIEDCNFRRKRNDIILRSLGRVEDKARALSAKTERLKILRDHYVTHLKQSTFQKDESLFLPRKCLPSQKVPFTEGIPKTVHWRTPHLADFASDCNSFQSLEYDHPEDNQYSDEFENGKDSRKILYDKECQLSSVTQTNPQMEQFNQSSLRVDNTGQNYQTPTEIAVSQSSSEMIQLGEIPLEEKTSESYLIKEKCQNISMNQNPENHNFNPTSYDDDLNVNLSSKNDSTKSNVNRSTKGNEPPIDGLSKYESNDIRKASVLREKGVIKHQESIDKLKMALLVEDYDDEKTEALDGGFERDCKTSYETFDQKIIEKDEIEISEKDEGSMKSLPFGRSSTTITDNFRGQSLHSDLMNSEKNYNNLIRQEKMENNVIGFQESQKDFEKDEYVPCVTSPKNNKSLPKGLDGVDYQNETYPESYYEQPVHHHNYSNIASNVILEEDESELDADEQPEENVRNFNVSPSTLIPRKNIDERRVDDENPLIDSLHLQLSDRAKSSSVISEPFNRPIEHQLKQTNNFLPEDGNSQVEKSYSRVIFKETHENFKESENEGVFDSKFNVTDFDESEVMHNGKLNGEKSTSSNEKDEMLVRNASKTYQTNITQMLESDSESFQIEHGDLISGNEDSDFDFSFRQN